MNKNDNSGPAFPIVGFAANQGLSKREWFAGMAMKGILANAPLTDNGEWVEQFAVQKADALIAELNKERP